MERLVVYRELGKLWDGAMRDPRVERGGYGPFRVRLDPLAYRGLMIEADQQDADVSIHDGGPRWRNLSILVEDSRPDGDCETTWGAKPLMTLEFRQPGEHGRFLYFDWSANEAALLDRPAKVTVIGKGEFNTLAEAAAALGDAERMA